VIFGASARATTACFDPAVQIWCADSEKGAKAGEYVLKAFGKVKRDEWILAENNKASRVLCIMLMKVKHDHAMSDVCGNLLTCMHAAKTPGARRWSHAQNYGSPAVLRGNVVVNLVIKGGANIQLSSGVIAATMAYQIVDGATFGSPVYRPIDMQKLALLPHFDRGCLHWGKNGISEGRTGTVHFDLDKLQLMDLTDSFGSKKSAGLVKPHVTDVKARIGESSAQSSVVVEDKVSLDSKHTPVEILFEPADQLEGTEAGGAQNALDFSETIGKANPKVNIHTLTKAHITDVKAQVPGDATAAPAPVEDNNDHEAKLRAYLPHSSLTLLGSPVLKFMRSTRPALLQRVRLDDVSKVSYVSLSLDTPLFMLGAVRNSMDVATLPNFVKEALASAEAAHRIQNKLARQFPDQVKTKILRSLRGTHKMRRFLKAQLNQFRAQADAKI